MSLFSPRIAELLEAAMTAIAPDVSGVSYVDLLEVPPDEKMGDYAFPCFSLARHMRRSPVQIAQQIADAIDVPSWLQKVEPVGGYLNFTLEPGYLVDRVLQEVTTRQDAYGQAADRGETVVIDFSSPNIAKPFTLGHIRSTMIGESIARILDHQGYNVVRINHLGDWGTQFGRLIAAYLKWGDEARLEDEPIKELFRLYVKFHEEEAKQPELEAEGRAWFKKLEDGDAQATELWQRFRDLSLEEFGSMYDRLGITFDDYTGESGFNDMLPDTVASLDKAGLLSVSEGAQVVELEHMPPCLIMKSDGATLYATRDIAAAIRRQELYKFSHGLYVVDHRQSLHFKQVFAVLSLLGYEWADTLEHIAFGTLQFGDEIMSTRKGNVIFLEDVLNEAVGRVRAIIDERNPDLPNKEQVAEQVGVGAVVFNDLVHNRIKDVVFAWDSVLSFEGDTGPYLQYTHARACSVLRRGLRAGVQPMAEAFDAVQWDEAELSLARFLARFPRVVATAAGGREPSTVARYVLDLAKMFNGFYHAHRILGSERQEQRLALTGAVKQVLANGLRLLAMAAPEEM